MTDNVKHSSEKRKMVHRLKWVVSPHRKDRRTGAIDPVPMDKYTKYNFDQIQKQFHGEKQVEDVQPPQEQNEEERWERIADLL